MACIPASPSVPLVITNVPWNEPLWPVAWNLKSAVPDLPFTEPVNVHAPCVISLPLARAISTSVPVQVPAKAPVDVKLPSEWMIIFGPAILVLTGVTVEVKLPLPFEGLAALTTEKAGMIATASNNSTKTPKILVFSSS